MFDLIYINIRTRSFLTHCWDGILSETDLRYTIPNYYISLNDSCMDKVAYHIILG